MSSRHDDDALLPRTFDRLLTRAPVVPVAGEGDAAGAEAAAGAGAAGRGGGAGAASDSDDSSGNAPAIGSDQAASEANTGSGGNAGGNAPAIGSDEAAAAAAGGDTQAASGPKGNDNNFNGYDAKTPNKAVTKLNDNINNKVADSNPPKFDAEITNPSNGQKLTKYQSPIFNPANAPNGNLRFQSASSAIGIDKNHIADPDVGISTDGDAGKWRRVRIRSTLDEHGGTDQNQYNGDVVEMAANRDGSALIVGNTDASADHNPGPADNAPKEVQKTPSSELIYQGAGRVRSPNQPASNLKVIARKTVNNQGTINTAREAYKRMGWDQSENKGVLKASAAKDTPEGQAFDAMMQTKNFEVSNFILADHHTALGDKVIQKIVMFPDKTFWDTSNPKASADFFLVLGPKSG
ncbi:MAG: hypothetical protein Q9227_003353 [Pyrenula ochraceoflavens]